MAESVEKVLSSYFHLGNQVYNTASSIHPEHVHSFVRWFLLDIPVVPVLLTFHCLNAAVKVHSVLPPSTFWLKSFIVTLMAAFGGSTLACVLTGRPAPLFTNASNFMIPYMMVAWYVVHKSWVVRSFLNFRPIAAVLAFGASAARMRAIFSFIDDYTREFPRVIFGAIVCGALSGSGGQFFVSVERLFHDPQALSDFSAPGWGFKSAYVAATLYYMFIDPDYVLFEFGFPQFEVDRSTARFYISAAISIHAALEALYGSHVNPLAWPEAVFYALTGLERKMKPEPIPTDTCQEPATAVPTTSASANGYAAAVARAKSINRPGGEGLRKRR